MNHCQEFKRAHKESQMSCGHIRNPETCPDCRANKAEAEVKRLQAGYDKIMDIFVAKEQSLNPSFTKLMSILAVIEKIQGGA